MKKKKCYFAIKNVSENQISNICLGWLLCLEKQDHETDSRSFLIKKPYLLTLSYKF